MAAVRSGSETGIGPPHCGGPSPDNAPVLYHTSVPRRSHSRSDNAAILVRPYHRERACFYPGEAVPRLAMGEDCAPCWPGDPALCFTAHQPTGASDVSPSSVDFLPVGRVAPSHQPPVQPQPLPDRLCSLDAFWAASSPRTQKPGIAQQQPSRSRQAFSPATASSFLFTGGDPSLPGGTAGQWQLRAQASQAAPFVQHGVHLTTHRFHRQTSPRDNCFRS